MAAPFSFDGSKAYNDGKYETHITLRWSYNENNGTLTMTHLSGGVFFYGTEDKSFTFEEM